MLFNINKICQFIKYSFSYVYFIDDQIINKNFIFTTNFENIVPFPYFHLFLPLFVFFPIYLVFFYPNFPYNFLILVYYLYYIDLDIEFDLDTADKNQDYTIGYNIYYD